MEMSAFILLFTIAMLGVGAMLFVAWLALLLVRGGGRLIGLHSAGTGSGVAGGLPCPRRRCGSINPPEARFCRRCGMELPRRPEHMEPRAPLTGKA